jgi:thioredoxin reductase (NADPH)
LSKRPFLITDNKGETYLTKTIIVATGSKPIMLGLENEDNLWSKGISSCAVCDGALYKNKEIVVVGKNLNK